MFVPDKPFFWIMLFLDIYAVACVIGLLLLLAELRMPPISLTHN